MSKQSQGVWRRKVAVGLAVAVAAAALVAGVARAQSPTPTWFMKDSKPGNSYPTNAKAVVVEGLGSLSCLYASSNIKYWTVNWANTGHNVITEISPQTGCGSLSKYETLFTNIKNYVEEYASNPGQRWGGFMLDEEPGFGFSASQLETLNQYVSNLMATTPGMSWYFEEDQPNGWYESTYYAILGDSWQAPQAYTSSMVSAINAVCSTYGGGFCTNAVTVDTQEGYPWDSASYVTGLVNGTSWTSSYWGSGHWYNLWRPQ